MKNPVFYIVDVFAEEKYAGNQLAVIKGAKGLGNAVMQKIARLLEKLIFRRPLSSFLNKSKTEDST